LHGRDPRDRKKFSIKVKAGKRAVTNWRVLEEIGEAARLEAELETGRTHQVRVHFAAMGCPLLGDTTYGRPPRDRHVRAIGKQLGRQALHARVLGFHHPRSGQWMQFASPPPADFLAALAALRELAQ
jgi:23S rRNA pseudouridine1911/1915/1917 synthase